MSGCRAFWRKLAGARTRREAPRRQRSLHRQPQDRGEGTPGFSLPVLKGHQWPQLAGGTQDPEDRNIWETVSLAQSRALGALGKCPAPEQSPLHPVPGILVELTWPRLRHGHVTRPGQSVHSTLLAAGAHVGPVG